jgi:hypothetical protein
MSDSATFRRNAAAVGLVSSAVLIALSRFLYQPSQGNQPATLLAALHDGHGRAVLSTVLFVLGELPFLIAMLGIGHLLRRRSTKLSNIRRRTRRHRRVLRRCRLSIRDRLLPDGARHRPPGHLRPGGPAGKQGPGTVQPGRCARDRSRASPAVSRTVPYPDRAEVGSATALGLPGTRVRWQRHYARYRSGFCHRQLDRVLRARQNGPAKPSRAVGDGRGRPGDTAAARTSRHRLVVLTTDVSLRVTTLRTDTCRDRLTSIAGNGGGFGDAAR